MLRVKNDESFKHLNSALIMPLKEIVWETREVIPQYCRLKATKSMHGDFFFNFYKW